PSALATKARAAKAAANAGQPTQHLHPQEPASATTLYSPLLRKQEDPVDPSHSLFYTLFAHSYPSPWSSIGGYRR
ncbi:hypothetical protein P7K49_019422, partial [Saguinus oedipus]